MCPSLYLICKHKLSKCSKYVKYLHHSQQIERYFCSSHLCINKSVTDDFYTNRWHFTSVCSPFCLRLTLEIYSHIILLQFSSFCIHFTNISSTQVINFTAVHPSAIWKEAKYSPSIRVMKTQSLSFWSISATQWLSRFFFISSSQHTFVLHSGTFRDIISVWFPNTFSDNWFSCDT